MLHFNTIIQAGVQTGWQHVQHVCTGITSADWVQHEQLGWEQLKNIKTYFKACFTKCMVEGDNTNSLAVRSRNMVAEVVDYNKSKIEFIFDFCGVVPERICLWYHSSFRLHNKSHTVF